MMVVTLDGIIAKSSNHFPDWSSSEDKKLFAKISKEKKVLIMGENTYNTFPQNLPGRLHVVFSLEENHPKKEGVKWVKGEPEDVIEELEKDGHKEAILGGGAFINGLFAERGLIDEVILTVEPKLFGKGLTLFDRDLDINLKFKSVEKLNEDTLALRYDVLK